MDQDTLEQLHRRCDPGEPLAPEDPRYVEIDGVGTDESPRGEDWVERVARSITRSSEPTCWLLTGPPGSGKSTELRRLATRLAPGRGDGPRALTISIGSGLLAEPMDIVAIFIGVVSGALRSVALKEGGDPEESVGGFQERGSEFFLSNLPALRSTDSEKILQKIGEKYREKFFEFIREELATLDARVRGLGRELGLVLVVDDLNQLQGHSDSWSEVLLSAERFFRAVVPLKLPVHIVYTVPPALLTRNVQSIDVLPLIRIRDRKTRAVFDPGVDLLREITRRRVSDEQLAELLGADYETRIAEAIVWSAGSPQALLDILRDILTSSEHPMTASGWRGLKHNTLQPYTSFVFRNDLELLARIHVDGDLLLDDGSQLDTVARMLERGLLSFYSDPEPWYDVHPAVLEVPHFQRQLAEITRERGVPERGVVAAEAEPAVRLVHVELRSIRCFDALNLSLTAEDSPAEWVLVLGDNAQGKSTLLRSIALGLCSESEAAALLEATPGRLIRYGHREARIILTLVDDAGTSYRSVTEIIADASGEAGQERLRRTEWTLRAAQVFVCGYGTNRTRTADQSHIGYSRYDAVRSLFDDDVSLQNPELVLRRQGPSDRERIERKLLEILMLDPLRARIEYSSTQGLEIRGPWAGDDWISASLTTLSDGYRSTTQWIVDLIGWLTYAGRFARDEDVVGIVFVDELEQHLHPRWQRYVIARIHEQFPRMQFIVSTHTPLLALGLADHENGLLVQLTKDAPQHARCVDPHEFRGLRADQVLTSHKGFGLATTRSPESASQIARYTELRGKKCTEDEEQEMVALREQLDRTLWSGETPYERQVEAAVRVALEQLAEQPRDPALEFELRRQLGELMGAEEPSS